MLLVGIGDTAHFLGQPRDALGGDGQHLHSTKMEFAMERGVFMISEDGEDP